MVALLDDSLARALGDVVASQVELAERTASDIARDDAGGGENEKRDAVDHGGDLRIAAAGRAPRALGSPARGPRPAAPPVAERRALEGAALALLVRSFAPVVHGLPVETLARVLATADPTAAAAALAATVATDLSARVAATPLVRAWFESARRKRELLEEAGGGLTAAQVAEARGVTRQAVERARSEQRLLAVPAAAVAATTALHAPADASEGGPVSGGASDWLYPAAQFGPDGQPLSGLTAVLRAFRATHVVDPWTQLSELLAPDPDLGGRSVFALLKEQGEAAVATAVAALREVGAMGA